MCKLVTLYPLVECSHLHLFGLGAVFYKGWPVAEMLEQAVVSRIYKLLKCVQFYHNCGT